MTATDSADAELFDLVVQLDEARRREHAAREDRIAIENRIAASVRFNGDTLTRSVSTDAGSAKFSIKRPVYHKVDPETWERVRKQLPSAVSKKLVRVKYDLALAEAKRLAKDNEPAWLIAAEAITTTTGKVAVDLREIHVVVPSSHQEHA